MIRVLVLPLLLMGALFPAHGQTPESLPEIQEKLDQVEERLELGEKPALKEAAALLDRSEIVTRDTHYGTKTAPLGDFALRLLVNHTDFEGIDLRRGTSAESMRSFLQSNWTKISYSDLLAGIGYGVCTDSLNEDHINPVCRRAAQ